MKAKSVLFFAMVLTMFLSGCFIVPDRVASKISTTLFPPPPPGYLPNDRIDVFNNIEGSVMTLHDRGGDMPKKAVTGDFAWVPQNTYFGNDGYEHMNNNTITARFYDVKTGEYLGLVHYEVNGGCSGYQAFHSPYERKYLEN